MEVPESIFNQYQNDVARISQFMQYRRFLFLSNTLRHRAIFILFRIHTCNIMRRAYWTIRAITLDNQSVVFVWCPREDPLESPSRVSTRMGRLLFKQDGSFVMNDDGDEVKIKEIRLQRVRLHYMCPIPRCHGNLENKNGTGPLVCDRCDFFISTNAKQV